MDGGARFAVGLLILWLCLLAFFFALHPNGVDLSAYGENPAGALKWLINEFQTLGSGTSTTTTSATPATNTGESQTTQNLVGG